MKELLGLGALFGFITSIIAAWITHIVWWISLAMNEELDTLSELALAIVGSIVAPIGVIHGYIIWFT